VALASSPAARVRNCYVIYLFDIAAGPDDPLKSQMARESLYGPCVQPIVGASRYLYIRESSVLFRSWFAASRRGVGPVNANYRSASRGPPNWPCSPSRKYLRIYPAVGQTANHGHNFVYTDVALREDDVLRFLDKSVRH